MMKRNQRRRALGEGRARQEHERLVALCATSSCCYGCMSTLKDDGTVETGDSRGHFMCVPGLMTLDHLRAERRGLISRVLTDTGWGWSV